MGIWWGQIGNQADEKGEGNMELEKIIDKMIESKDKRRGLAELKIIYDNCFNLDQSMRVKSWIKQIESEIATDGNWIEIIL